MGGFVAAGSTMNAMNAANRGNFKEAMGWTGVAELGRAQAMREAVAGRSEERAPEFPEGMTGFGDTRFLTCNYKDDLNRDGLTSLDEFVGIKRRFSNKEKVMYVFYNAPGRKGAKIAFFLKNNHGKVIHSFETVKNREDFYALFKCSPGKLPAGTNRGSWYVDGEYAGSSDAEIVE